MSFSHPRQPDRVDDEPEATPEPAPADLLELLDADHTQTILAETRADPRSARALADACGASRATIYRRLNRLEDAGLVTSSMRYDADGHHRTVYEATLESVTVDVTDDGYALSIATSDGASTAARPPLLRSSD
jgi:predicted transcriptional regulator